MFLQIQKFYRKLNKDSYGIVHLAVKIELLLRATFQDSLTSLGDQNLYPRRKEVWHKEMESCIYRELYMTQSVLSIYSYGLVMAEDVNISTQVRMKGIRIYRLAPQLRVTYLAPSTWVKKLNFGQNNSFSHTKKVNLFDVLSLGIFIFHVVLIFGVIFIFTVVLIFVVILF